MGTYGPWQNADADEKCPQCRQGPVRYRIWESGDEAFEDVNYACLCCNHHWWVEGGDS